MASLSSAVGNHSLRSLNSLKIHGLMSAPRPVISAFTCVCRSSLDAASYCVRMSPFAVTGTPIRLATSSITS